MQLSFRCISVVNVVVVVVVVVVKTDILSSSCSISCPQQFRQETFRRSLTQTTPLN